jgi:hypothetical protein
MTVMITAFTVQAATEVGGIIHTDTVWSEANSPYILISEVQVAYGATLTIEPNVFINGNDNPIKLWGRLEAIGTDEERITFNNVYVQGNGDSPTNRHHIHISFSEITGGGISGGTYGELRLYDSILKDTEYISLQTRVGYGHGIRKSCYVERNIFDNAGGISCNMKQLVTVYIKNNVFYGQTTNFAVRCTYMFSGDETTRLDVKYNSFLSNDRVALRLSGDGRLTDATENYWNTTDSNVVDLMIYDRNDDLGIDNYIHYNPILEELHEETPIFDVIPEPVCLSYPIMDFTGDCKVDFADFAVFLSHWLECNLDPPEACWQ